MTAALDDGARMGALRRLERLKKSWIDFTQTLEEMVEKRDHETLGYATFTEMWTAHMADLQLSGQFLVHVAYHMLAEGTTTDDIVWSIKGLGPTSAETIKRQRDRGVPPEHASPRSKRGGDTTVVREHERQLPTARGALTIELGELRMKRYQRVAAKVGVTVKEIAMDAIEDKFLQLGDVLGMG